MWNWENKVTHNAKEYYSRYIASWIKAHGGKYQRELFEGFRHWLRDECELNEEEIHEIYEMATTGKLEFEGNAQCFIKNYKEQ